MFGSLNDFMRAKLLSYFSIWFKAALAAKRNVPDLVLAMSSPVYAIGLPGLSTAMTALVGSTVGFQPLIVPSSVAKMNKAEADLPPLETMKPPKGFAAMPVGQPGGKGSLDASGMVTTSGWILPSPVYMVANPVNSSATQKGLVGK